MLFAAIILLPNTAVLSEDSQTFCRYQYIILKLTYRLQSCKKFNLLQTKSNVNWCAGQVESCVLWSLMSQVSEKCRTCWTNCWKTSDEEAEMDQNNMVAGFQLLFLFFLFFLFFFKENASTLFIYIFQNS